MCRSDFVTFGSAHSTGIPEHPTCRPDPSQRPSSRALGESASYRDLKLWHRSSIRRIVAGFAAVAGVIIFGVLGYISYGWTFFDALFMVVITISGVGFGEVRPMGSTGSESTR